MSYQLALQKVSQAKSIPKKSLFKQWVTETLQGRKEKGEITIRVVDEIESAHLNETFRHHHGPTNVLSFPFVAPPKVKLALLGDLVICAPIVIKEAQEQDKDPVSHWAHLTIHGTLHLLGYDHLNDQDADRMEGIEIAIMKRLGFPNPYLTRN